jgi:hypothetical protein
MLWQRGGPIHAGRRHLPNRLRFGPLSTYTSDVVMPESLGKSAKQRTD